MILGIDIGGTHTDAVLIDAREKIVWKKKVQTTYPPRLGVSAIFAALIKSGYSSLSRIAIGSTHALNALLTSEGLSRVGVIRLSSSKLGICPGADWQGSHSMISGVMSFEGGYECDGRSYRMAEEKIYAGAQALMAEGAEAIAIVSTFGPLYPEQEMAVLELLQPLGIPLSASYALGGLGLLERENATILNAALQKSTFRDFSAMEELAKSFGLTAPLYFIQNQGSLLSLTEATRFPIKTMAAGPTLSALGGARLMGLSDTMVLDIGGTSTDLGTVLSQRMKKSSMHAKIGGIPLCYHMPDVLSIALGGGTLIQDGKLLPQSLGSKVSKEAQAFGGTKLCLTDVALKLGLLEIEGADPRKVNLGLGEAEKIRDQAQSEIAGLVEKMRGPRADLQTIAVGGGALLGLLDLPVPRDADSANAYGAALAEKSVNRDLSVSLETESLDAIEAELKNELSAAGADMSRYRLVEKEIIPYAYIPGRRARVIMTGVAPLLR